MGNQAVKEGAQSALVLVRQAAKNLLVALVDHGHGAPKDFPSSGRQRQHHAAAITGVVSFEHQPLIDQRLGGAAGLAFVQVGLSASSFTDKGSKVPIVVRHRPSLIDRPVRAG